MSGDGGNFSFTALKALNPPTCEGINQFITSYVFASLVLVRSDLSSRAEIIPHFLHDPLETRTKTHVHKKKENCIIFLFTKKRMSSQ